MHTGGSRRGGNRGQRGSCGGVETGRSAGSEVCGAASAIWRWTRIFCERLSGAGPLLRARRRRAATARVTCIVDRQQQGSAEAEAVVAPFVGVRMTEAPCPATTFREACRRGGGQFGEHWPEQMPRISWLNFKAAVPGGLDFVQGGMQRVEQGWRCRRRRQHLGGRDTAGAQPFIRMRVWRTCSDLGSLVGESAGRLSPEYQR